MCTGIRALPNFPGQSYADYTNVAMLHYSLAPPITPLFLLFNNPEKNTHPSRNLLKETDLHVGSPTI